MPRHSRAKHGQLVALAYLTSAAVALLGAKVIGKSHDYYRAARAHFQEVELRLGLFARGLALSTTPGMARVTGARRMRVATAAKVVLCLIAGLDLLSAVLALR